MLETIPILIQELVVFCWVDKVKVFFGNDVIAGQASLRELEVGRVLHKDGCFVFTLKVPAVLVP